MNVSHPTRTLPCPELGCGSMMELRRSSFGLFYGCTRYPHCAGTHGAHPDGSPLGIAADHETKQARIRAHEAFDQLWRDKLLPSRKAAYRWMQEALALSKEDAHIGRFSIDQCEALIAAARGMGVLP
jgi:ssDNA-binding Zn-finger/Zn-ribbon topoisomerase 1